MVSGYISGNFGQFYYVIVIITPLLEVVIEFSNDSSYERSSPNSSALMLLNSKMFIKKMQCNCIKCKKSKTPQAEDDDKKYAFYML